MPQPIPGSCIYTFCDFYYKLPSEFMGYSFPCSCEQVLPAFEEDDLHFKLLIWVPDSHLIVDDVKFVGNVIICEPKQSFK